MRAGVAAPAPPWLPARSLGPARWSRGIAWALVLVGIAAAVALLDPEYLAGGVAAFLAVTLVLARPAVAVPLLLFSVPFGSLAQVDAGSFSISVTEPLVALLALAWIGQSIGRRRIFLRAGPLVFAALGIVTLMLFSITYAISAGPAVKETVKWVELVVLALAVRDLARDDRVVRWLLVALFAAGSIESVYGLVQFATGAGPAGFELEGTLRAFGNFDQPNPFAGYLATIFPVAIALAFSRSERWLRWTSAVATLVVALGIGVSQSRGAWLGLGVAIGVMLLVWSRRSRLLLIPAAGLGVLSVILAVIGVLPPSVVDRLGQTINYFGVFDVRTVDLTSDNFAIVERMAHWQAGWYMFLDHPWLGVGAGNYAEAYPQYYLDNWLEPLGHAHNYYLNTMAELGVVGLALLMTFLVLAYSILGRAIRAARTPETRRYWRPLLVGILGSLVVFCTHNLFDNLFVHSVNVQLGFLLGLALVGADRLRLAASAHEVARA